MFLETRLELQYPIQPQKNPNIFSNNEMNRQLIR